MATDFHTTQRALEEMSEHCDPYGRSTRRTSTPLSAGSPEIPTRQRTSRIRFFEKDPYAPIQYSYEVSKVLYHKQSRFQDIMVFENPHFGRVLVLDGVVQITERDEFLYHEMLSQVVMSAHPNPRKVIVIGGGDGGTVREVEAQIRRKGLFH